MPNSTLPHLLLNHTLCLSPPFLKYPLTFTLLNILCQLTEKNLIVQLEIEGCYFVFFHLTGQALSPPRRKEGSYQFSWFVMSRGT